VCAKSRLAEALRPIPLSAPLIPMYEPTHRGTQSRKHQLTVRWVHQSAPELKLGEELRVAIVCFTPNQRLHRQRQLLGQHRAQQLPWLHTLSGTTFDESFGDAQHIVARLERVRLRALSTAMLGAGRGGCWEGAGGAGAVP
jgi:hypothetical protein